MAYQRFSRLVLSLLLWVTALVVAFFAGRASTTLGLMPGANNRAQLRAFGSIQRTTMSNQRRQIEQLQSEKRAMEALLQRLQAQESPSIQSWLEAEAAYIPRVTSVSDGDMLDVRIDDHRQRVRLFGIDSPEIDQPFGDRALEFTTDLCFGNEVEIIEKGRDEYGVVTAKVLIGNVNVGHELLRAGLAWHDARHNNDSELENLEKQAREDKVGLWSDENPIPPWEWWER